MVSFTHHTTNFGALLTELWQRAGLSQLDFAHRVHRDPGYICRVRSGARLPPREATLKGWADVLGLDAVETERLLDLAALQRTPARIQQKFIRLSLAANY